MQVFSIEEPLGQFSLVVHRFEDDFSVDHEKFLSLDERQAYEKIQSTSRRKQFSQSRYWLKQRLTEVLEKPSYQIHFRTIGEGKPVLSDPKAEVDFNLSHTSYYTAFAISQGQRVGVDIEEIRRPSHFEGVMNKVFAAPEVRYILSLQNLERQTQCFVKLWSAKEAIVKAVAGGVFKHSKEIEIDCENWKILKLPGAFGQISQWQLHFYDEIEDHIVSVATARL